MWFFGKELVDRVSVSWRINTSGQGLGFLSELMGFTEVVTDN